MLNPSLTSLTSLLALLSAADALKWRAPRATPVARLSLDSGPFAAPKVTAFPRANDELGISPRAINSAVTLLQAPDATCGFFGGSAGAPLSCPSTDTCVMTKTAGGDGAVGCCPIGAELSQCGFRNTCIDADSYYNSTVCNGACLHDSHTLKCTASSAPYCNTISWPDDKVRDFFCDDIFVSGAQTIYTTYSGETGRTWDTVLNADSTSESSSSESSSSTSESSTESTSATSTSTTATPDPTATPAPAKSAPAGAIAGGVVGGVAVIGLVVVAVIFLLRRNKKQNAAAAGTTAGAAGPGGAPPPVYTQPDGKYTVNPDQNMPGYYAQNGQFIPQGGAPEMGQQQPYGPPAGPSYYDANAQQYYAVPQMQQQPSPNSAHVNPHHSGGYADRGETTSPSNTARFSAAGTEGGLPGGYSPRPGYSEMSANMTGGPFPQDQHVGTWEVEGSGVPPKHT